MKDVEKKDLPEVPGGVKPGDTGDGCTTPAGPLFPDFPRHPQIPYVPLPDEPTV